MHIFITVLVNMQALSGCILEKRDAECLRGLLTNGNFHKIHL